ncbi:ribonuclease D [Mycetocola tolaasinivorans]|uniref:Ribonuclease D n=1 Tax=Mycetocola tolaasinivorans TaxID=76635 RepID=A0A3L7AAH4_9MICO|nr:ribonuclease D [Mycetocola tolaasinivorans]
MAERSRRASAPAGNTAPGSATTPEVAATPTSGAGAAPVVSVSATAAAIAAVGSAEAGSRRVIDTPRAYAESLSLLAAGHGPVAVDAERASGYRYSQRAYLIQVFRRDAGMFLYDPIALGSLHELQAVIGDAEWVLHAASQDLACLREVGLDPSQIFDTELAARLLGMPRVGLGSVVENLLGIHLAKEHSAADWSTRPLPQSWLEYAALDVELLVDLRDEVEKLLIAAGKTEIARQEFAAELNKPAPAAKIDPWRKLSGAPSARNRQILAVARELWTARDTLARRRDVAPGRLVPDAALQAAVKANPKTRAQLAGMRAFTGRASRTELNTWWSAIERGQNETDLPPLRIHTDTLPPIRAWAEKNPEADHRLRVTRPRVVAHAEAREMPVENLLTPELLRRIAWHPPVPLTTEAVADQLAALGARPWQVEETAQLIRDAFVEAPQIVLEDDGGAS